MHITDGRARPRSRGRAGVGGLRVAVSAGRQRERERDDRPARHRRSPPAGDRPPGRAHGRRTPVVAAPGVVERERRHLSYGCFHARSGAARRCLTTALARFCAGSAGQRRPGAPGRVPATGGLSVRTPARSATSGMVGQRTRARSDARHTSPANRLPSACQQRRLVFQTRGSTRICCASGSTSISE